MVSATTKPTRLAPISAMSSGGDPTASNTSQCGKHAEEEYEEDPRTLCAQPDMVIRDVAFPNLTKQIAERQQQCEQYAENRVPDRITLCGGEMPGDEGDDDADRTAPGRIPR